MAFGRGKDKSEDKIPVTVKTGISKREKKELFQK